MTELRWRLADDDGGQPALFGDEELGTRHVGRGEYAGLEFLEVKARRIINTVSEASRLPFRHTINAYRGCSHACSYCLAGETRVLLASGRTKPIADLTVGDELVGTRRIGRSRRFVSTHVLAHWSTARPAFSVDLEDGTRIIGSADHRFLTPQGWKHVTGAEQGRNRRPHLTTSNVILGLGSFPRPPTEDAPYRRGYLCGMLRGDAHLAHDADSRNGRVSGAHRLRPVLTDLGPLERARAYLASEGVDTQTFAYPQATTTHGSLTAIMAPSRRHVAAIESLTAWPLDHSDEWAKGFLAGIYDAEGSLGQVLSISNADPEIVTWTKRAFTQLGFRPIIEPRRQNGVMDVRVLGGWPEASRFMLLVDPATTRQRSILGRASTCTGWRRVEGVEDLGIEMPMYDITTETGDFIAEGAISHNCFARPTHEYLGLGIGTDFDSKIVVKVNAVERLRAELASPRWAGEAIAMGTNTDPYQRCEGRYRLTRGIVEVLGKAANPFSILTKSPLILGDLGRLQAAAERTDVATSFSIGTLDEEVWRASEPGTAHPRKRVEAVARLNEAGIPCGVLVAPVLPGLSDADGQLRQVVEACVAAGAVSVSALALHLRPGVRPHFMAWLAGFRPDLVADYERRFRRAYLPAVEQAALSRRVRAMVGEARGRWHPPRRHRALGPPAAPAAPPVPPAPVATQLDLDV